MYMYMYSQHYSSANSMSMSQRGIELFLVYSAQLAGAHSYIQTISNHQLREWISATESFMASPPHLSSLLISKLPGSWLVISCLHQEHTEHAVDTGSSQILFLCQIPNFYVLSIMVADHWRYHQNKTMNNNMTSFLKMINIFSCHLTAQ